MKLLHTILFACMILLGCKAGSQKQKISSVSQSRWTFPDMTTEWQPRYLINGLDTMRYYQQTGAYERLKNHEGYEKLLSKITNIDSYWYLTSKNIPLDDRLKSYFQLYDPVRNLYGGFYTLVENGKFIYSHEVTLLHNFLMELMKVQLELTDAFLATHKNPTKIQRDGLEKVIQGAKITVTGNLIIIEKEYKMYTEDDICSQTKSFYNYYQYLRTKLDKISKAEFDQKVKDVITKHPIKCINKILE